MDIMVLQVDKVNKDTLAQQVDQEIQHQVHKAHKAQEVHKAVQVQLDQMAHKDIKA